MTKINTKNANANPDLFFSESFFFNFAIHSVHNAEK